MRWRPPSNCSSTPWWTMPSRRSRSPAPIASSRSTVPCSSTPARMRFSQWSRLRLSSTTDSIAAAAQELRQHEAGRPRADDPDLSARDGHPPGASNSAAWPWPTPTHRVARP